MPSVDIYGMPASAPVRIVQMTAECAGVSYNFKLTDLMKGEHMTPEYLKMNPQHTIPTVVDGEDFLCESRAIATYLINKYAQDDKLYPKDNKTRYEVDKALYFDMGVFYKAFGDVVYPKMFGGAKIEQKEWDRLHEVLGWVNGMVADGKFAAGTQQLTVADLAFVATYSTLKATEAVDTSKYTDLEAWFSKCKDLIPNYEKANGEGAAAFGGWYKSM